MIAHEPSARPTVLITGATGALGGAVIRAFDGEGWQIRTLSRNAPPAASPAAAYEHFMAEIDDRDSLRRAMRGVDAVVHLAALLHVFDPSKSLDREYSRVNVGGTEAVMTIALESTVRRVVALSSIAVYGPHAGLVDEETPPEPDTAYGRSKLDAERVVLKATPGGGSLGCVLRLAAVYGPSVKGNYERLVRALARRRFVPVGTGQNTRTLVFEDDAAEAILLAASKPVAGGQVFNVTDGEIHTVSEIVAAISEALGRRPPGIVLPFALASAAVSACETLCRLAGSRSPVTSATLNKYVENVAVAGERISRTLGFAPRWSLSDGWRHTIAELRREGRL
jgi:UDP-glucose 4-epimerase